MDHFFAPFLPSPQSGGATEKLRLLTNHFLGDTTYNREDGINSDLHTYQATWVLHYEHANIVLEFLRDHAGKAFLWNMPRENVDRIWEATEWTRTSDEDNRDILQVTFEERFLATTPGPALPPPPSVVFRFDSSLLGGVLHLG